jgi:putative membrane protein
MLWLKAFHIVFVVAWFAGIFYLPRLFVYHSTLKTDGTDGATIERFKVMERRLFGMMTFGAVFASAFAIAMLITTPVYLQMPWMHFKLTLVVLLFGYHVWCYRLVVAFREDRNTHSERWFRVFNEMPLFLLIGIVLLVVLKPSF